MCVYLESKSVYVLGSRHLPVQALYGSGNTASKADALLK